MQSRICHSRESLAYQYHTHGYTAYALLIYHSSSESDKHHDFLTVADSGLHSLPDGSGTCNYSEPCEIAEKYESCLHERVRFLAISYGEKPHRDEA